VHIFLKTIATALSALLVLAAAGSAHAESTEIHYLGFNSFGADKAASGKAFDTYIKHLRPIMAKYGMTAATYNVRHGGNGDLKADVVTFGTAKDQASFQAFFQDPDFQKLFPQLLGALDDHQVVFTSGSFAPHHVTHGSNILLSVNWLNGEAEAAVKRLNAINHKASHVFEKYGVQMLGQTAGVYSNRGLAADVKDTHPPQLLELWAIKDAHGFFDDEAIASTADEIKELTKKSESFWLAERKIH